MNRTLRWHLTTLRTAAITTLIALPALTPPAAHADNATFKHYSPDNGYDAAIRIACDNGDRRLLAEGEVSNWSSKCPNGTRSIYLRDSEDLVCLVQTELYGIQWVTKFRGDEQWHPVSYSFGVGNYGCVLKVG